MKSILDDLPRLEKSDPSGMRKILERFPEQIEEARALGAALRPGRLSGDGIRNVIFSGLGGSAIGADIIKGYLLGQCKSPVYVNRSYDLPEFVNSDTLLVVSSYSGNTEETVAAYEQGIKKSARIVALSSGGKVADIAAKSGHLHIKVPAGYPPRTALGYAVIAPLLLLEKLGLARVENADLEEVIAVLRDQRAALAPICNTNPAKDLAIKIQDRFPHFYAGGDAFEAVALRWRGQVEENAKRLSSHQALPEMNHNEIAGWENINGSARSHIAVFLRDSGEHPRISARMKLAQEFIRSNGAETAEVWSLGRSLLARIFTLTYLGDYCSFYLALLAGIDPTVVRAIDHLKNELLRTKG